VFHNVCRPVLPADNRRRLLVARGRYGGSLFRDQSGLVAACAWERHTGAAVARAGGAGIQGIEAVLARSMMTELPFGPLGSPAGFRPSF
jgi:hypothetical protein